MDTGNQLPVMLDMGVDLKTLHGTMRAESAVIAFGHESGCPVLVRSKDIKAIYPIVQLQNPSDYITTDAEYLKAIDVEGGGY
jgi:hypothetical protein